MRVRRTPWWHYALALVLGLALGAGLARLAEAKGLALIGAPWLVTVMLAILGIVVLALALQVHKYANTDPVKRPNTFINPTRAMNTLMLAKALGLAGAALAGYYGGQILVSWAHIEAPFFRDAIIQCAVAAIVCLADMIVGIIAEWLCQLPPTEGPEHPKVKERAAKAARRALSPAAPTAKTSR